MQIQLQVNMFGSDLKRRYGEKIHKLTLHGGFSCPNRDGTLGRGGCTFCNVSSFADEINQYQTIEVQLAKRAAEVKNRAKRYLAYFQAYTSTYAEVCLLKKMYEQALNQTDIVGLCVGTRPDCVSEDVLKLLSSYQQQGYEVWLELGLQSAHDKTLKQINRGHDFASYIKTAEIARQLGLKVCTHLIVGLPGETKSDCLATLDKVVDVGVDGLKLHPLHIVEGSTMAKAWANGRLAALEMETYTEIAGEMIRHTPIDIIYHRVSATAQCPPLLAPLWCEKRWPSLIAISRYLTAHGNQGSALNQTFTFQEC